MVTKNIYLNSEHSVITALQYKQNTGKNRNSNAKMCDI